MKKIGTKNLLTGILVLSIIVAIFSMDTKVVQAGTTTTTTYYYYTNIPGAQPIVINGITFYPTSTVPPEAQYYPYVPPASTCQVQQPVCQPVYQPTVYCQITPQTNSNSNGINGEAYDQMNSLRWYASERRWNTNWKTVTDTDCAVTLSIEFSNRNGKFTVQQTTSVVSAGKYSTVWTWNGQTTSADAIKQALSAYCAK